MEEDIKNNLIEIIKYYLLSHNLRERISEDSWYRVSFDIKLESSFEEALNGEITNLSVGEILSRD